MKAVTHYIHNINYISLFVAKNTPNNTGIALYGDFTDFENLYEALHGVVGDEDELIEYFSARIRVFGVCYDIRHALMGDREYEFVDNGLDEEKKGVCLCWPLIRTCI